MDYTVSGIKCDEDGCGWTERGTIDVREWHNRKCPKCNVGIIVDDHDLESMKVLDAVRQINKNVRIETTRKPRGIKFSFPK